MRGLVKHVAEKLALAVGQGFIPGMKPMKSEWASAPEVCASPISPEEAPFPSASDGGGNAGT
jgi:hypothetical protein